MPVKFSQWAEVDPQRLLAQSAFDPILDVDTRLFLDPHLLSKTRVPELAHSYERLQVRFTEIARLLLASDSRGDPFWRAADRLMIWPEVKGLCIGYTSKGTEGRGMGAVPGPSSQLHCSSLLIQLRRQWAQRRGTRRSSDGQGRAT